MSFSETDLGVRNKLLMTWSRDVKDANIQSGLLSNVILRDRPWGMR